MKSLTMIVLILAGSVLAADTDSPKSPAALQARAKYDKAVVEAQATRDQAVKRARTTYLVEMGGALDAALTAKDLAEANRISAAIKVFEGGLSTRNSFDLTQWQVAVWDGKNWTANNNVAVKIEPTQDGCRIVNNCADSHFVKLELKEPIRGDFDLVIEYIGARKTSLRRVGGSDASVGTRLIEEPDIGRFHRAEFSRRGSKWTLRLDGKSIDADYYNADSRDWPGYWGVAVMKGETAEITYFSLRRM